MKLSKQLIGKKVTFIAHHEAFPSMHVAGEIISVIKAPYQPKNVQYSVKDTKGEIDTITLDEFTVKALLKDGEYISDSFASRETKKIYIK